MSTAPTIDPPNKPVVDQSTLSEDQILILELAATVYGNTNVQSLEDAYRHAKRLVQILRDDPEMNPPAPEEAAAEE